MILLTTNRFDDDHSRDERTLFSIFVTSAAGISSARDLQAPQHRGHEATGIVSIDNKEFHAHRRVGHFGANFGADSLAFFSIDGLYRIKDGVGSNNDCHQFCDACFPYVYPIELASGLCKARFPQRRPLSYLKKVSVA